MIARIASFVDRWHWALLVIAAPFLLFPAPGPRVLALLVVPGLWLVAWLARGEFVPRTPLTGTLAVMFLAVLVSTWATPDLAYSLPKLAGMVLCVAVFYAFARYGQAARTWWYCLLAFLAAGAGVAVLGLLGTDWIDKVTFLAPVTSRLPLRFTGLQGAESGFHPNEVAGALVWAMPLLLALCVQSLVARQDWLAALGRIAALVAVVVLAGATLLVTMTLLLTQSRGGYLGLGFAILGMAAVALPAPGRRTLAALLAVAAVLVAGVTWAYGPDLLARVVFGGINPAPDAASPLDTWEGRAEIWSRAIYGIQDFPFSGMGMNTFRRVVHGLYPLFLNSPDVDVGHAHNEFLQAALDLGIPGLIAFVSLYIGAFWMMKETWDRAQGRGPGAATDRVLGLRSPGLVRWLLLGLGGGLAAHLLYGLTDAVALGAKPGVLFWMLLGLIAGLYELGLTSGR